MYFDYELNSFVNDCPRGSVTRNIQTLSDLEQELPTKHSVLTTFDAEHTSVITALRDTGWRYADHTDDDTLRFKKENKEALLGYRRLDDSDKIYLTLTMSLCC